uniref:Aminotransferase-like protein n=1 Tax=Oryza sativa subsp. japonica TaxID=39947 RepID=Q53JW5_ORYSJ|nr:hypothetical protein LOC_Os11g22870 [Oryza sativa Japonica Group]
MSTSASPFAAPSAEYAEVTGKILSSLGLRLRKVLLRKVSPYDVTYSANLMTLNSKNQFEFKTKTIGGWSGYIAANMGIGSVTPQEHTAFLLMWLEKFLFCGSSCGPTTNWQFLAEALEAKKQIPLGKILLGYLYQMLNNASAKIAAGSVVGAGGPSWLLQTWLNLVAKKAVNRPALLESQFPRLELITSDDGEVLTHRRCMSYGEAASTPADSGAKLSAELLKDWFCRFYEGFQKDARVWFAYEDSMSFELPSDFRFEEINSERYDKSREVFLAAISPCEISSTLMMDRLLNIPGPPLGSIKNVELAKFRSRNFDRWWGEWKQHLFHQSASMYMTDLFPDVIPQTIESSHPRKSNSGKDIEYASGLLPNGGGLTPPSSATMPPGPQPSPPPSPPVQSTPSDRTPSAAGSHNIEEEEQRAAPAIPALADLFLFDIKDYFDEEVEEKITSKTLVPLDDDVKRTLEDISHRLETSLDNLVVDCGTIRARFAEIQSLIPNDLANTISPAVYLEQHQFKVEKAKQRIADRRERRDIEATIQTNRQTVHEEKAKLDQLLVGPIQTKIDRLEARRIDLIAQLEECNAEMALEQKKLTDIPKAVEEQKSRLKLAIRNVADLTKSLKVIPGTDAQDIQAIEEVDQISQRAVSAIQRNLSR